jgi:methionyl-tRNA formyltransferase
LDKFSVILFGLTGAGNFGLKALVNSNQFEVLSVFTGKRQLNPFPYYETAPLYKLCEKHNIQCFEGLSVKDDNTYPIVKKFSPDLIVVSTFDQILPNKIIQIPKFGIINVHPSLLPQYRGANPIYWTLVNGEQKTGLTIVFIENGPVDGGRIVAQESISIDPSDTGGTLRKKLDQLSGEVLIGALSKVLIDSQNSFIKQNEDQATYFPRIKHEDYFIDLNNSAENIFNQVKALTPFPLARLIYENQIFQVTEIEWGEKKVTCGKQYSDHKIINLVCNEEILRIKVILNTQTSS